MFMLLGSLRTPFLFKTQTANMDNVKAPELSGKRVILRHRSPPLSFILATASIVMTVMIGAGGIGTRVGGTGEGARSR